MSTVGKHCILDLYGCHPELLDDLAFVQRTLARASTDAGATWMGEVAHRFEPQGVTALGLLAESHISIHTWPELGFATADVFTCGDKADPVVACNILVQAFQADRHSLRVIDRAEGFVHNGDGTFAPEPTAQIPGTQTPTAHGSSPATA